MLKLFVDEPGAGIIEAASRNAALASSSLAYVEARAALARMHAGGRLPSREYASALRTFEDSWSAQMVVIELATSTIRRAAALAERHALRAYDAVHLAAAIGTGGELTFATWDRDLHDAARDEGLTLLPEML